MNAPTPEPDMQAEQGSIHGVCQDPKQPSYLDPRPPLRVPPRPATCHQPPQVHRYCELQRAACKQKNDVYLDRLEFIQVQDQANGRGGGGEGVDEFEVERVGLERPRGDGYAEPLQVESDPDPDAVTAGVRGYLAGCHRGRPSGFGLGRPAGVARDKRQRVALLLLD